MQEITKDALSRVEGTERLVEGEESASILHGSGRLASTFLPKESTGGDVAGLTTDAGPSGDATCQ